MWIPLLILTIVLLAIVIFFLYQKITSLKETITELNFKNASQSVKYGKLTEQWLPFAESFPFDAQKFRFLGNPVDGLVFDEDRIFFCEFKTNTSRLNQNQRRIKELVQNKKVDWLEFKIK